MPQRASWMSLNPIHHDIFSNWFMRELIINSIWIIDTKNSFPSIMSCLTSLVVEKKTGNHYFTGLRFESCLKQLFLLYNFLFGGYFCSWRCLRPAVANFELMISSLMMNRVQRFRKDFPNPPQSSLKMDPPVGPPEGQKNQIRLKVQWVHYDIED